LGATQNYSLAKRPTLVLQHTAVMIVMSEGYEVLPLYYPFRWFIPEALRWDSPHTVAPKLVAIKKPHTGKDVGFR
jgi:hypothetical protein